MTNLKEVFGQILKQVTMTKTPKIETLTSGDGDYALVPDGFQVQKMPKEGDKPHYTNADILINDVESFLAYWDRFKNDQSAIFADSENMRVTGYFDYHKHDGGAERLAHKMRFVPIQSDQSLYFRTTLDNCGRQWIPQFQFQRFLEYFQNYIIEPNGGDLLSLIETLNVTAKINVGEVRSLSDGSKKIKYTKDNVVKGDATIPKLLTLGLPVFVGGIDAKFDVRIRFDTDDETGQPKFILECQEFKETVDKVFKAHIELISQSPLVEDHQFFYGRV